MISQLEVPAYVHDVLPPQINPGFKSPYAVMRALADYTQQSISAHNYQVVKKCFAVADKLYCRGNKSVQNAVQNVFVYSLTRIFQGCPLERGTVQAMIPVTLYSLYIMQHYQKGC